MYVTAREKKLPNIYQLKQEFLKNTILILINCSLPTIYSLTREFCDDEPSNVYLQRTWLLRSI